MEDKLRIGCKFSFLNLTYQFQKETEKNNQLNLKIAAISLNLLECPEDVTYEGQ